MHPASFARRAACLAFALPVTASAQLAASLSGGAARMSRAGEPAFGVATMDAFVVRAWPRLTTTLSAAGSAAPSVGPSGQVAIAATVLRPANGGAAWQLAGSATATGAELDLPTFGGQLRVRRAQPHDRLTTFVGGAGGAVGSAGRTRPVWIAEAGAAAAWSRQVVETAVSFTRTEGEVRALIGSTRYRFFYPVRDLDAQVTWRAAFGASAASFAVGGRAERAGERRRLGWAAASLQRDLGARVALVLSAGRSLDDPVRGLPPMRHAAVLLRVHAGATGRSEGARQARRAVARPEVHVEASGDLRVIRIVAPNASTVELMADFTGWEPLVMSRDAAGWVHAAAITPGAHRLLVRIDGGEWTVPANLPRVADDYGGHAGLLAVP